MRLRRRTGSRWDARVKGRADSRWLRAIAIERFKQVVIEGVESAGVVFEGRRRNGKKQVEAVFGLRATAVSPAASLIARVKQAHKSLF